MPVHSPGVCHSRLSPVFVLGHSRSGTSLICRLLLDHLGVNFGTESQFIVRYHQRLARYGNLGDEANLRLLLNDISRERFFARTRQNFGFVFDVEHAIRSIEQRTYAGALRSIFEQFAATKGMVRWGDKTPDYCNHLPLLRSLFPDVQFLHVVRDGRDVACSNFRTGFGPKNCYEAALDWKKTLEQIRRFRDTLPEGAFAEVRYEELLENPVATLGSVAQFLGVENSNAVIAAAVEPLRTQVRSGNAFLWKQRLSWREIECFEAFAGDELTALGYALKFRPRKGQSSIGEAAYWRAQALVRRVADRRYWADNWYKLGVRVRAAALPVRALARPRGREVLSAGGLRPSR